MPGGTHRSLAATMSVSQITAGLRLLSTAAQQEAAAAEAAMREAERLASLKAARAARLSEAQTRVDAALLAKAAAEALAKQRTEEAYATILEAAAADPDVGTIAKDIIQAMSPVQAAGQTVGHDVQDVQPEESSTAEQVDGLKFELLELVTDESLVVHNDIKAHWPDRVDQRRVQACLNVLSSFTPGETPADKRDNLLDALLGNDVSEDIAAVGHWAWGLVQDMKPVEQDGMRAIDSMLVAWTLSAISANGCRSMNAVAVSLLADVRKTIQQPNYSHPALLKRLQRLFSEKKYPRNAQSLRQAMRDRFGEDVHHGSSVVSHSEVDWRRRDD